MAIRHVLRKALETLTAPRRRERTPTRHRGGAPHRPGAGQAVPRPGGHAPATDIPDLDGITITYAPEPGAAPDPGEVVWTWVPYEDDPAQGKDRPVALFGRRHGGLVGVALTSKGGGPHEVLVGTGPWDPQRRPSFAKLDRILDVDGDRVRRVGGVLDRKRFDDLIFALRQFYA
jgi:hypothetical protein